jgi:hypothetical protein
MIKTYYPLMKLTFVLLVCSCALNLSAQTNPQMKKYTRADTLRGTLTPERTWWDVQ